MEMVLSALISCYDISAVALLKCVGLSNITSGIFGNVLNAMIFTFLRTKFAKVLKGAS